MQDPSQQKPVKGLYHKLLAEQEESSLLECKADLDFVSKELDAGEAHAAVAQYLEKLIFQSLSLHRGEEQAQRQRRLVDRMIQLLAEELNHDGEGGVDAYKLTDPLRRLIAIHAAGSGPFKQTHNHLSRSDIFTGGSNKNINLSLELQTEIAAADRVDILCSFIKWSGLRLILDSLKQLTATPSPDGEPRLRVITTSYMGATDPEAIDRLLELSNTEVKVSYDTQRTRLHAKAYIIHRNTGFGSAYIGSANLSHAALSEGLEWTPKVSQYELPHLWSKVIGTFTSYWESQEFEAHTGLTKSRLKVAIDRERKGSEAGQTTYFFDLKPHDYQQVILDTFSVERDELNKKAHLLVAATGTGKTMIAAFDYKQWGGGYSRPKLLFIAHREEILRQALGTYRAVLRDQNFGDLLIGQQNNPDQRDHLFCSIQSYNSKGLNRLAADHFDYVVVDEFHRAEAASYQTLLNHVQPKVLLGMTATPERADGLDVFRWFGGRASAEIRLPDAIERQMLCPFQYFGISDLSDMDLSRLTWKQGGYDANELDRLYTGNDVRADLILRKLVDITLNPQAVRGLAFCVSINHAKFMAQYFTEHGVPAMALSSLSSVDDRRKAQQMLISRKINFLCVVDLYNEGVDIPEIDTVLLLRPTESLTVYLQQLGRGLRRLDGKSCLTVLDFIGGQHQKFRFASRFRALSSDPTGNIEREIQEGFPHLPTGCAIQMERIAQQRILDNVRHSLNLRRPEFVAQLRNLYQHTHQVPTLESALTYLGVELDDVLRRGAWSRLLSDSGATLPPNDCDEERLAKGVRRLAHIDDPGYLRFLIIWLKNPAPPTNELDQRRLNMLFITLFSEEGAKWSIEQAIDRLSQNPAARSDLLAVLEYRQQMSRTRTHALVPDTSGVLNLHANYTRDEILAGLGYWSMQNKPLLRSGVLHLPESKVDALFITLHKTEEGYSPTTMYEDYAISESLFHWQSQSTTSAESSSGQRYIRHKSMGYTPLLFVREHKSLSTGLASPYCFLGSAVYVKHEGSRPMSITWKLEHPMPARVFRVTATQAVS